MYKKTQPTKTAIKVNGSYIGETIENKIRRIVNNKEPITDGAPLIYTERKQGIMPEYNVKTDRWEVALDAMDYIAKSHKAKREERAKLGEEAIQGMKKEGEAQPIRTTENK